MKGEEQTEKLVLGIEGGGSKTDWIFLTPTSAGSEIIAKGQLPFSNIKITPELQLIRMMQLLPPNATHVGVFLAGCVTEEDRNYLRSLVHRVWPSAVVHTGSDRDSGLAAAFEDQDRITVISGTGSAVTGRKGGRIEKAGGRGHLLGDSGGAYVICIQALRLALRTYDLEHRTSDLSQSILRELSLSHMEELMNWVQSADKMSISRLTPVIFDAAKRGDEEVMLILKAGALTLAKYTRSVAQWLDFRDPPVKLLGGLFLNQPTYVDLFESELRSLLDASSVAVCRTPGSFGAAWLASRDLKIDPKTHTSYDPRDLDELACAATEQRNSRSSNIEFLAIPDLVELMIEDSASITSALRSVKDNLSNAVELLLNVFQEDGSLFYIGAGTSGRLGVLDASEIPPTFGEPPERVQGIIAGGVRALSQSVEGAEDDPVAGAMSVRERGVTDADVVCGISASGRTPFVLGALKEAKRIGAKTILLTCNPQRNRNVRYDSEIDLPTGAEIVTGSTRLKAGTATKIALNILTTCSMIKFGKTQGNWMAHLMPTNQKLRLRAIRMVSARKGVSIQEAEMQLQNAAWNIPKVLGD